MNSPLTEYSDDQLDLWRIWLCYTVYPIMKELEIEGVIGLHSKELDGKGTDHSGNIIDMRVLVTTAAYLEAKALRMASQFQRMQVTWTRQRIAFTTPVGTMLYEYSIV